MGDLKRAWNPCKVCKKYYDYTCENKCTKNCYEFVPENSFLNFLAVNKMEIITTRRYTELDRIYLVEDNFKAGEGFGAFADLRKCSFDIIKEKLYDGVDFIHIFVLSINKETRDFIYNDDYIMSHYNIKMLISDDVKKTLKYRLDERFGYVILNSQK